MEYDPEVAAQDGPAGEASWDLLHLQDLLARPVLAYLAHVVSKTYKQQQTWKTDPEFKPHTSINASSAMKINFGAP